MNGKSGWLFTKKEQMLSMVALRIHKDWRRMWQHWKLFNFNDST